MTDWETRYYEAEASHTEANGMLTAENERLKRLHTDAFHEAERWKEREAEARRALSEERTQVNVLIAGLTEQTVRTDDAQASESIAQLAMERLRSYAENVAAAANNVIEECQRRSADVEQGRARAITVPWLDLNVLRQTIAMKPGADRAQVLFDQECADTVALEAQTECVHETGRDWTEDAAHENGNYQNQCVECGEFFIGHKRRHVCKLCVAAYSGSCHQSGREVPPSGIVVPPIGPHPELTMAVNQPRPVPDAVVRGLREAASAVEAGHWCAPIYFVGLLRNAADLLMSRHQVNRDDARDAERWRRLKALISGTNVLVQYHADEGRDLILDEDPEHFEQVVDSWPESDSQFVAGKESEVTPEPVEVIQPCPDCDGRGMRSHSAPGHISAYTCGRCKGRGHIPADSRPAI